jgi:hypothetical protein
MTTGREYKFRIDTFTPDTLPMERLAEYMREFACLLGERERVHFIGLEDGSVVIVAKAEPSAASSVERRLLEIKNGFGDKEGLDARRRIDDMLQADDAIGQIIDAVGAEIIHFPGRTRPMPLEFGPFREEGIIEGVVIRVGGKDDTVPVWLKDGSVVHKCTASVALSKQLSECYHGPLIRATGSGRWKRAADGSWQMLSFDIKNFEILDETPLAEMIEQLRDVRGAHWGEDSLGELMKLRSGEGH